MSARIIPAAEKMIFPVMKKPFTSGGKGRGIGIWTVLLALILMISKVEGESNPPPIASKEPAAKGPQCLEGQESQDRERPDNLLGKGHCMSGGTQYQGYQAWDKINLRMEAAPKTRKVNARFSRSTGEEQMGLICSCQNEKEGVGFWNIDTLARIWEAMWEETMKEKIIFYVLGFVSFVVFNGIMGFITRNRHPGRLNTSPSPTSTILIQKLEKRSNKALKALNQFEQEIRAKRYYLESYEISPDEDGKLNN